MSIRILATADLHLGRASADVTGNYVSSRYTWNNIVEYCLTNRVDVLVLCGDIVDRQNRFFEAIGPMQAGCEKLVMAGIKVMIVSGNHDYDVLPEIVRRVNDPNVRVIGANGEWQVEKITVRDQVVQFAGWSFPSVSFNKSALISYALPTYDSLYPCIGLLHGDIDAPGGSYNPFRLAELDKAEIDLWVLGHVHGYGRMSELPHVWYTGSPHALSAKEPGEHGPLIITVDANKQISVEKIQMSPVLYKEISITVDGADEQEQIRDKVISCLIHDGREIEGEYAGVMALVYNVILTGSHGDVKAIDSWSRNATEFTQQLGRISLLVRKVSNRVKPALVNLEELSRQSSPAGVLAKTILAIQNKQRTPFLDDLIKDWMARAQAVYQGGVYTPLLRSGQISPPGEDQALECILDESNRLLSELKEQIGS